LGRQGWRLLDGDLPLPCAVLKESALEANSAFMAEFLAMTGTKLCPHGKTTMSPELMLRQIADGSWGITAANARQMQVMKASGIRRVLIANQVVDGAEIATLSDALWDAEFDLYVLVDSVEGVERLDEELRLPEGRRLKVLLEIGQTGARTGARSLEAALTVARAAAASGRLALSGVETFEGVLGGATREETEGKVRRLYEDVLAAATACEVEGLFAPGPVILSGGGSAYYDLAAEAFGRAPLKAETLNVVRSGCYLTHDAKHYEDHYRRLRERSPDLAPTRRSPKAALEVWAAVQSLPEPGLAFATMGKRDVSYDMELPVPVAWHRKGMAAPEPLDGHSVLGLNDQHAKVARPAGSPLQVGDLICFGISHPCTTFDKWRLIPVVDDGYQVVGAVRTEF
jgi:D-serine dehydratase